MTTRDLRWQEVLRLMPPAVRAAMPDVLWRRDLLWTLTLPTEEIAITNLVWLLDLPLWAVDNVPFRVTPNDVRLDPVRYAQQYQRTMAADLDYPIHLVMLNDRWTILDGVHRLLKADMTGLEYVRVMKLSDEEFRSIVDLEGG